MACFWPFSRFFPKFPIFDPPGGVRGKKMAIFWTPPGGVKKWVFLPPGGGPGVPEGGSGGPGGGPGSEGGGINCGKMCGVRERAT